MYVVTISRYITFQCFIIFGHHPQHSAVASSSILPSAESFGGRRQAETPRVQKKKKSKSNFDTTLSHGYDFPQNSMRHAIPLNDHWPGA